MTRKEDSDILNDEMMEKFNKTQYRNRFGITYFRRNSKILGINLNDHHTRRKHLRGRRLNSSKDVSLKYPSSSSNIDSSFQAKPYNILNNEIEQIELNKLYGDFEKEYDEILPIHNFNKVSKCSISKYGVKKSTDEIEYSYCKTCDYNLLKPICLSCINQCHKGHLIKYIFNRGRIKCSCGEKNHVSIKINDSDENHQTKCFCNEWNIIAKLNFYYVNKNNEPICILCHNYCENEYKKDKIIRVDDNTTIPRCSCKNEKIHNDNRVICEKIYSLIINSSEFDLLLHPIQFINMLFKSKNNFKFIFEYFDSFMINLNSENNNLINFFSKVNSADITFTNIYKTLLIFEKIIQKISINNYISCFNEEIVNYFSFNIFKKLFLNLRESSIEEKLFLTFTNKYTYLFRKIYINYKTHKLEKFKINDLKNLSLYQRIIIFKENKKKFTESEEIITLLLKFLMHIIYKNFSSIESIKSITEIVSIFRKLSSYNLININYMTQICINITKCLDYLRIIRNTLIKINNTNDIKSKNDFRYFNKIELKLFYMIIKMLMNFIYNYNDNTIDKIIHDKEKYPDINNITIDNVNFIHKKNDIGRFIFKITIYIITIIHKNYINIENKRINLIQKIGMEILQNSLIKNDDYYLNIILSLNKIKYYSEQSPKLLNKNNHYYKELSKYTNLIFNAYYQYFNFELSLQETLDVINESLNFVLKNPNKNISSFDENDIKEEFTINQKMAILRTNYYSLLCKIISLIHHHKNKMKNYDKMIEEYKKDIENTKQSKEYKLKRKSRKDLNYIKQYLPINNIDEIIKKILYFYFCFALNSSDNSYLILSYYVFNELIKVPNNYCQLIFKLFYLCVKNISTLDNNITMVEPSNIIKRLYNYFEKLLDDENIKQNTVLFCVYYLLQILEIIIFNSQSSFFNILVSKIQYILLMINTKFNIVNKFFDMKDDEFNLINKNNRNKSDRSLIQIPKIESNDIQIASDNNNKNLNNSFVSDFFKKSTLTKSFIIFIKLINNCFDFSLEIDRKQILEIISEDKVIFALNNYKINLDLRTEFLRFLRKMIIDLKFSTNEKNLFANAIINTNDNLKEIKSNLLINNLEYPTQLLSFLNNFYNITTKCNIKEKLEKKICIKNIEKTQNDLKSKADFSYEISSLNKTNIKDSGFFEDFNNNELKDSTFISKNYKNNVEIKDSYTSKNYKINADNSEESEKKMQFNRLSLNNTDNSAKKNSLKDENIKITGNKTRTFIENKLKKNEINLEEEKNLENLNFASNKSMKKNKSRLYINEIIPEENFSKAEDNDNDIDNDIDTESNDESKLKVTHVKSKSNLNMIKISVIEGQKPNNRLSLPKDNFRPLNIFRSTERISHIRIRKKIFNHKNNKFEKPNDINSDDLDDLMEIIKDNNNDAFYLKCKHIDILENVFNEDYYNIINDEIDNCKTHIKNIKLNSQEKIGCVKNYIENGLLIPLIFYFKKVFTLVHLFTGKEMIKLYLLIEKSLSFKLYLFDLKNEIWENCLNKENIDKDIKNSFLEKDELIYSKYYYYTNYGYPSIIRESYFLDTKSITSIYESLDYIKSNKTSIFDYSSLYQIIEKEFFTLIKDRKLLNIIDNFKEKNNYEILNKKTLKEEEKLIIDNKIYNSNSERRLLKALIIYKHSKLSCFKENNSSFLSILSEISLGYDTNYRNLLITLLINYGKNINIKNEYVDSSYYLFFKILCLQAQETQNEIINILGGIDSDNPGFLEDFSQIMFYRIMLVLIDFLNPPDKLIQSNYFISCNLIYIFKFLCVKHNHFFQFLLIKSLSFNYTENNPSFFKFGIINQEYEEKAPFENSSYFLKDQEKCIFNIRFYDFFLFLLTKIILISNWNNNNKGEHKPNPFLYELFYSTLDLLTEIIQGSKPELLSILFDNIDQKLINIIGGGIDLENYKYNESFEVFIKIIADIIFQEKNDLVLINEIKNNLMYYVTSILEEKNYNDTMHKFIKKYLNINNVYRIISKIMKSYFLSNKKSKKFQKIKNQIVGLISKNKNIFKRNTKISMRRRNTVSVFSSKLGTMANKKRKKQNDNYEENSTSNMKLITTTIIDSNKDLKNNLLLLNFDKNQTKNYKFKKLEKKKFHKENSLKSTKTYFNKNNKNNTHQLQLKISELTFGNKLYNFFLKQFYNDPEFLNSLEFKLCNSFYRFIKIIKFKKKKLGKKPKIDAKNKVKYLKYENENDEDLDNSDIKDNSSLKKNNLNYNTNYEKDSLEKYYIEKFFEKITTTVEIRTNISERTNKTVIYTHLPTMKLLSRGTKIEFIRNVNRENEINKKNDLMRYIEYFIKEIKYYKKYNKKWNVWISKISFHYLEKISYTFALLLNLFILFTMKGDLQITSSATLKERRKSKSKIQNFIDISNQQWNLTYVIINYFYLITNGIFIILWVLYKLPLFYRLDKVKYKEIYKKGNLLTLFDKIYILKMCIIDRDYISMLIYEFIVCSLCLIIKNNIFYTFLLLPILFINKTLKSLIISIKLNFYQFCLTFCFAFIIIFIFSDINFFFLNSDFITELDYYEDNYCKTLIFSFLNALDYGLRARGGIGDSSIRISFLRNKKHYITRLILDDIFFLLIVIIMIDMVFGIVIKSFDELRHTNQKYHSDELNYCLICHSNRELLEKMRINYNDHIKNSHNIWNYVEYMISLKLRDIHDLNAINQYVRTKMDKKDISWLPTYKDINIENEIDFEEKNLIVFHENIEGYKIKSMSEIEK